MSQRRKIAVIYNERSGQQGQPVSAQLKDLLAEQGVEFELHEFDPGRVGALVLGVLDSSPDAVLAAGGDGTVTSVAQHLVGTSVPLGVLPMGTMNVLARDLGVPEKLDEAVPAVLSAPTHSIDVARVNDRLFLCSTVLAVLPHLGRIRERARSAPGHTVLQLVARTFQTLRTYPRMRLSLTVDGTSHEVRTRAVVVSNNPLSEGPAPMPGRGQLDTGKLAVYVARDRTRWDLAGIATKVMLGSWKQAKRLRMYDGESVRIDFDGLGMMSVMTDGEVIQLTLPLQFELAPRALAVLMPGAES